MWQVHLDGMLSSFVGRKPSLTHQHNAGSKLYYAKMREPSQNGSP
jgi:hypothetical protein